MAVRGINWPRCLAAEFLLRGILCFHCLARVHRFRLHPLCATAVIPRPSYLAAFNIFSLFLSLIEPKL